MRKGREGRITISSSRRSNGVGEFAFSTWKITVGEIAKRWRKAKYSPRRADELRATTAADYETILVRYILPRWGAVKMTDIRAGMLEVWRNELLEKGIEPEWKPIGGSTVRKCLLVMGILFRYAMRDHIVSVNPAAFVKKPSVRTRKAAEERLTPEQLAVLFTHCSGRTRIVVRLAATTGMREGEIFGLRWRDVDTKGRMIRVRRQYTHGAIVEHGKTDAALRDIGIDAKLAAELAAWKLQQKPERREDDSLVIAISTGEPISASNFLSRDFRPALKRAELPRVNFHSLLHTAATILASSNIPPGTVHRILGHANYATTMKLYGGLTAEALEKAAGALGDAFERPSEKGVRLAGNGWVMQIDGYPLFAPFIINKRKHRSYVCDLHFPRPSRRYPHKCPANDWLFLDIPSCSWTSNMYRALRGLDAP